MSKFEVSKGQKTKVVTSIINWPEGSDTQVLDIRTYVLLKDKGWIPTPKGVQIPTELATSFSRKLRKLVKQELEPNN